MSDILKVPLDQFVTAMKLASRAAGTYTVHVDVAAPAVLSNVWFRAGPGASVQANWFCVTTGALGDERFDLMSHPLLSGPPQSSQVVVTHAQGRLYLEVIVTGGAAEFGVMAKGVPDFPITFDTNTPIPIIPFEGTAQTAALETTTTPGAPQTLLTILVASMTRVDLYAAIVSCSFVTAFKVKVDGVIVGSGRTGPGEQQARFPWTPLLPVAAGATITLELVQSFGPAVDVEAFLEYAVVNL